MLYFLTDMSGEKKAEIEEFPTISLAWADNGSYRYAVVSGKAKIANDRSRSSELWSKIDEVWWEGKDDPTIRLLTVTPEKGEIWDSPNAVVTGAKMLVAVVIGAHLSWATGG